MESSIKNDSSDRAGAKNRAPSVPAPSDLEESASSNGGNNSDNSALVSIGNTSFGFNFDSDDRMSNRSSERQENSSEDGDSNGNEESGGSRSPDVSKSTKSSTSKSSASADKSKTQTTRVTAASLADHEAAESLKSLVKSSSPHQKFTEAAIARLKSRASDASSKMSAINGGGASEQKPQAASRKRKATDNDSNGGYNTDDEGNIMVTEDSATRDTPPAQSKKKKKVSVAAPTPSDSNPKSSSKKKTAADKKREDRNAREKERSFRISKQIDDLRALLSAGGVVVPKGTKSSVLTEAANYIRLLQQHQYRSEIERQQLMQQMQLIGSGSQGPQAATAIRQAAAQQGVWSLGNFGGMPPQASAAPVLSQQQQQQQQPVAAPDASHPTKVQENDYRAIFNSAGVGMAIASMGGGFIDCNPLFCSVSNYSKQELCSLTIFNLTERESLQQAFEIICKMLAPTMSTTGNTEEAKSVVLRGAMKSRNDVGMCVSLVKGENGIPKCFCVTLVKSPSTPFETKMPIPVGFDQMLQPAAASGQVTKEGSSSVKSDLSAFSPAFTAG